MRRIGVDRLIRNPLVRYTLLGLLAAGMVIAALTLLAAVMVEDWSQRDIDLRSRLVFRSIRDQVAMAMTAKPDIDLAQVFERITSGSWPWVSAPRRANCDMPPKSFRSLSPVIV
jgi:trehalose 6-phosphate synthase